MRKTVTFVKLIHETNRNATDHRALCFVFHPLSFYWSSFKLSLLLNGFICCCSSRWSNSSDHKVDGNIHQQLLALKSADFLKNSVKICPTGRRPRVRPTCNPSTVLKGKHIPSCPGTARYLLGGGCGWRDGPLSFSAQLCCHPSSDKHAGRGRNGWMGNRISV